MKLSGLLSCIDSHAGGMPNRIVVGGLPYVPGRTMADKERYLSEERDDVRQLLMSEPRGSATMAGVIVTEPVTAEADCGLIWIEPWGYPPGCGHGTIATTTALVETGILKPRGAEHEIVYDTVPARSGRGSACATTRWSRSPSPTSPRSCTTTGRRSRSSRGAS